MTWWLLSPLSWLASSGPVSYFVEGLNFQRLKLIFQFAHCIKYGRYKRSLSASRYWWLLVFSNRIIGLTSLLYYGPTKKEYSVSLLSTIGITSQYRYKRLCWRIEIVRLRVIYTGSKIILGYILGSVKLKLQCLLIMILFVNTDCSGKYPRMSLCLIGWAHCVKYGDWEIFFLKVVHIPQCWPLFYLISTRPGLRRLSVVINYPFKKAAHVDFYRNRCRESIPVAHKTSGFTLIFLRG